MLRCNYMCSTILFPPKSIHSSLRCSYCVFSVVSLSPSLKASFLLRMASKATALWRSIAGARRMTTSTAPKLRPIAPTADGFFDDHHRGSFFKSKPKGEFVPVYVALGLIALSLSFGLYTANLQLRHAPNVLVSKKKRETLPEVVDPDWAATEAEHFINSSIFRRVAHLQDFDSVRTGISDPTREHSLTKAKKVETLKSVGIEPGSMK